MVTVRFLALIAPFLILGIPAAQGMTAPRQTVATVVVTLRSRGVLHARMSTNNVWPRMIDEAHGAEARLSSLHAPLVRLHAGDDGDPVAMPEVKKGKWSFRALDTLVIDVRRTGQWIRDLNLLDRRQVVGSSAPAGGMRT